MYTNVDNYLEIPHYRMVTGCYDNILKIVLIFAESQSA